MKRRGLGFTLIELMVVISIIVILLAVLLPALGVARVLVRKGSNKSQIRGIVMQLTTFANSNKEWYPGLNSDGGVPTDAETPATFDTGSGTRDVSSITDYSNRQAALSRLAHENFISEKSLKSPGETDPRISHPDVDEDLSQCVDGFDDDGSTAWTLFNGYNDAYFTHGSYAILEYWSAGASEDWTQTASNDDLDAGNWADAVGVGEYQLTDLGKLEWRLTGSPTAIVVADRHHLQKGVDNAAEARKLALKRENDHTSPNAQGSLVDGVQLSYWSKDADWYEGAAGFNDGHVEDISKPGMALDETPGNGDDDTTGIQHDARYGAAGSATGIKKIDHLFRWDPANIVNYDPDLDDETDQDVYEENFRDNDWVGHGRLIAD